MANPAQITRLLQHVYKRTGRGAIKRVPVNIIGHRGMFKTQLVEAFARKYVGDYAVVHLGAIDSPGDVWGVPKEVLVKIKNGGADIQEWVTRYARPEWWPGANRKVGVCHLDEPNRANSLVMPLLLDFLVYGRVGTRVLPPGWIVVSTMNPVDDEGKYAVNEMDDAIMDRMLHVPASMEVADWLEGFAIPNNVHPDLQDLILQDGNLLNIQNASLPKITPSPRSWELFNILYEPTMPKDLMSITAAGLFGPQVGQAVVEMLQRTAKPFSPLEILDHYGKMREYIQVYSSVRFAQWEVINLTIDALNRCTLSRDAKRLMNLKRFHQDLPQDQKGHLKLWKKFMDAP